MIERGDVPLVDALRQTVHPLPGGEDPDALLGSVGEARIVLLGASTHGTREFYAERARLTRRLVEEKGFGAVAIEADWPDAYRVNRWVRGLEDGDDADAALSGFRRFPGWVWRNAEVLELVRWLRARNDALPAGGQRAGFYGLDLYSLHGSVQAVVSFLEAVDPAGARTARERYRCFDAPRSTAERYVERAAAGDLVPCEDDVVEELVDMLQRARRPAPPREPGTEEAWLDAVQNARVVMDAEAYYRTMVRGTAASWNLRERHMADTLDALLSHLDRHGGSGKIVVWEHSSHAGDARATELRERGELSLGQLVRARHGDDAFLVGFTTWSGEVLAAPAWGAPARPQRVEPAARGSYEAVFHEAGVPRFSLDLRLLGEAAGALRQPRLERAIGVLRPPEAHDRAEYVTASLPSQFDAVVHVDVTTAVEPLDVEEARDEGEAPGTYPTGM